MCWVMLETIFFSVEEFVLVRTEFGKAQRLLSSHKYEFELINTKIISYTKGTN